MAMILEDSANTNKKLSFVLNKMQYKDGEDMEAFLARKLQEGKEKRQRAVAEAVAAAAAAAAAATMTRKRKVRCFFFFY